MTEGGERRVAEKTSLPEGGDNVDGRPANDEGSVTRLGHFGDFVDAGGQPQLGDSHFIFQFEIAAGTRFGDQQQIVEEKQVPILTLQSLRRGNKKRKQQIRRNIRQTLRRNPKLTLMNWTAVSMIN